MKIAVFGMGLMGGSLGRAIIKKTNHTVYGYDVDNGAILKAKMLSACHDELTSEQLSTVDVVILALKPSIAIKIMGEIVPKLKAGAIVTDICGNKRKIISEMKKLNKAYENINFVGIHPMAGREFSGISHSSINLFEHSYILMVPVNTNLNALSIIKKLYMDIGCKDIVITDAKKHDEIIAYTSQLAHIVSSSYIKSPTSAEHLGYSAGSFRDMTRVAKLDPDMWTELFMDNRDNLLSEIKTLEKHLEEYRIALEKKDSEKLHELLADGVIKKQKADSLKKESVNA